MLDLSFAAEVQGVLLSGSRDFALADATSQSEPNGATRRTTTLRNDRHGIRALHHTRTFPGLSLIETWIEVANDSQQELTLTRLDTINATLPADDFTLRYFTSDWGQEFTPVEAPLRGTKILETTTGRSSKGMHPWFALESPAGRVICAAIAWSGNWIFRFEPSPSGAYRLSGGLSNWQFAKTLQPGQSMEAPHILLVDLPAGDVVDASIQLTRWGRRFGYPRNASSQRMPVEWNHWWPYEDAEISDSVFRANTEVAAQLGVEICTLDAGWFGPSEATSQWYRVRGDWDQVNTARFPSGVGALSRNTHSKQVAFGIWCEIEAAGEDAALAKAHPEYLALRDGKRMGYICMANPQARAHARGVLEQLIHKYGANWIKLDFNLDPGPGCNRTDHGHGAGDGLYEHYRGYYQLLDDIRTTHPEVILEDCSSGGLRIDLGILQHLHLTFLSDPDYTEHSLQVMWGASMMLHPSACLHFTWSHTRPTFGANRVNNPIPADAPLHEFDYIMRAGMLHNFAFSYRLPDLTPTQRERLAAHISFYKAQVREILRNGDFYALTGQPLRTGAGDRWPAFLTLTEDRSRGVLFVFRLTNSEGSRQIRLRGLDPKRIYTLALQDQRTQLKRTGADLMRDGLLFDKLEPEGSEVVLLTAE